MRLTAFFQRLVSAPEFGPLILLVVEILVFTVRAPAFLSASNISNLVGFHAGARHDHAWDDAADDGGRI